METNKLIAGIVAAAIAIIVLAGVLMPALSNATTTEDTFTNEGVFYYGIFEPTDTYTLTWDVSTGTIVVNDVTVTPIDGIQIGKNASYSIISSDDVLLRFGSTSTYYYMQVVGKDSNSANVSTGGTTGSATITGGQLSVTAVGDSTTTKTFDFTELYAIVPTEDQAILKASSSAVYIKGDSPIYASGLTNITNWNNMFHFEGTYDDGITISSPNMPDATYDNITWNIQPVEGYIDLYKLTSIEFDITNNGTTVHATYSYFGVPSEVTAERSVHLTDAMNVILNVIPLLIIVAVLLGVVAVFILRRE